MISKIITIVILRFAKQITNEFTTKFFMLFSNREITGNTYRINMSKTENKISITINKFEISESYCR